MHRFIGLLSTIAALSLAVMAISTVAYAAPETFAKDTLKGIKTVTVEIDTPPRSMYSELKVRGVTVEKLQAEITEQLRQAGFNVITFTEALEDPEAALLRLRINLVRASRGGYSYGLNLSAKRKIPLGPDTSFQSVKVWEDGRLGGMRQSYLSDLGGYSYNLVDNFINAHRLQN